MSRLGRSTDLPAGRKSRDATRSSDPIQKQQCASAAVYSADGSSLGMAGTLGARARSAFLDPAPPTKASSPDAASADNFGACCGVRVGIMCSPISRSVICASNFAALESKAPPLVLLSC